MCVYIYISRCSPLSSRLTAFLSYVILNDSLFIACFRTSTNVVYLQRYLVVTWLVPRETAAILATMHQFTVSLYSKLNGQGICVFSCCYFKKKKKIILDLKHVDRVHTKSHFELQFNFSNLLQIKRLVVAVVVVVDDDDDYDDDDHFSGGGYLCLHIHHQYHNFSLITGQYFHFCETSFRLRLSNCAFKCSQAGNALLARYHSTKSYVFFIFPLQTISFIYPTLS